MSDIFGEHGIYNDANDAQQGDIERDGEQDDGLVITPLPYETRRKRYSDLDNLDEATRQRVSRRRFLRRSTLAVTGLAAAASVGGALAMLYPNLVGQWGGVIDLGPSVNFPAAIPDKFVLNQAGIFYQAQARAFLVHLASETRYLVAGSQFESLLKEELFTRDADGSYWLALYQRCTHLGTMLRFRNDCVSFKCPSHGAHFNCDGEYLDGPAPRDMDRFPVSLHYGRVSIDTGQFTEGARHGNISRLLSVPAGPCLAV